MANRPAIKIALWVDPRHKVGLEALLVALPLLLIVVPDPFPYLYDIHAAALLKQQSKDYDRILKDLAPAERSIPACSLCYLAQSKAHRKMGERNAATADLEKALELDATYAEAWYRLASLYDQEGRHAEAQQARHRF